jgi:hypothetical protein
MARQSEKKPRSGVSLCLLIRINGHLLSLSSHGPSRRVSSLASFLLLARWKSVAGVAVHSFPRLGRVIASLATAPVRGLLSPMLSASVAPLLSSPVMSGVKPCRPGRAIGFWPPHPVRWLRAGGSSASPFFASKFLNPY